MQCLHRFQKVLFPGRKVEAWSNEEDDIIINQVGLYGAKNWSKIAKKLEGRIGKQCRERWYNNLNPELRKNVAWSDIEKQLVFLLQKRYGNKWSTISSYLKGRCDNNVKNLVNSKLKRDKSRLSKWEKEEVSRLQSELGLSLFDCHDKLINDLKTENDKITVSECVKENEDEFCDRDSFIPISERIAFTPNRTACKMFQSSSIKQEGGYYNDAMFFLGNSYNQHLVSSVKKPRYDCISNEHLDLSFRKTQKENFQISPVTNGQVGSRNDDIFTPKKK